MCTDHIYVAQILKNTAFLLHALYSKVDNNYSNVWEIRQLAFLRIDENTRLILPFLYIMDRM